MDKLTEFENVLKLTLRRVWYLYLVSAIASSWLSADGLFLGCLMITQLQKSRVKAGVVLLLKVEELTAAGSLL